MSRVGLGVSNALKSTVQYFLPFFQALSTDSGIADLSSLNDTNGDYNYYSIDIKPATYFRYVDSLCHMSARLMGIGEVMYRGVQLQNFKWAEYNTSLEREFSQMEQVIGLDGGISIVFDPSGSVSDTISTSTTESQFSGLFNNLSAQARELDFVLGYTGTHFSVADVGDLVSDGNIGQALGIGNTFQRFAAWLRNTSHGMNIRFPEIWSDSQHSPSYEADMHFISPYATAFSKWRWVLVPFWHIFCMAAPQGNTNAAQYSSPFLIRAFSKGYFNVEMGIIESITWKRFGEGDMISEDGIPTQIDVSISFKDMYHTLYITDMNHGGGNLKNFMNNAGLIDMIGTMSGVNMNRRTVEERISLYLSNTVSIYGSLGSNWMRSIADNTRSKIRGILGYS